MQWRIEQLKQSRRQTEIAIGRRPARAWATSKITRGGCADQLAHYQDDDGAISNDVDNGRSPAAGPIAGRVASRSAARSTRPSSNSPRRTRRPPAVAARYAVVPYEGPNQTHRRPIYIECRDDAVVLQPERIGLTDSDFEGPLGPGNPLAAALRAAREYMLAQRDFDPQVGEPYPLLLVRPEGISGLLRGPRGDEVLGIRLRLRADRRRLEARLSAARSAAGRGRAASGRLGAERAGATDGRCRAAPVRPPTKAYRGSVRAAASPATTGRGRRRRTRLWRQRRFEGDGRGPNGSLRLAAGRSVDWSLTVRRADNYGIFWPAGRERMRQRRAGRTVESDRRFTGRIVRVVRPLRQRAGRRRGKSGTLPTASANGAYAGSPRASAGARGQSTDGTDTPRAGLGYRLVDRRGGGSSGGPSGGSSVGNPEAAITGQPGGVGSTRTRFRPAGLQRCRPAGERCEPGGGRYDAPGRQLAATGSIAVPIGRIATPGRLRGGPAAGGASTGASARGQSAALGRRRRLGAAARRVAADARSTTQTAG